MRELSFLKLGAGATPSRIERLQESNWYAENLGNVRFGDIQRFHPADKWIGHYVEPHPYHLMRLISRLGKKLMRGQYQIYQLCIAGSPSLQLFKVLRATDIEEVDVTAGLHPKKQPNGRCLRNSFYVPIWTLQEFLREADILPDLIDMNIEGSELVLIENYDFKHKPAIWIIEAHQREGISPQKIAEILKDNDYDINFHPDISNPHVLVIANLK